MADFKRARSAEQKEQRLGEVKRACAELFATRPYHEITLTTIAEQLSWSRANLYKYVCTKEEAFLALIEDERDAYYAALFEAFPTGDTLPYEMSDAAMKPSAAAANPFNAAAPAAPVESSLSTTTPLPTSEAAARWANVADAHQLWFRLHDLLFTIIETNVSVERLMEFKRGYYEGFPAMATQLGGALGIRPENIEPLMSAINFHGSGIVTSCYAVPAVREAMGRLGVSYEPPDFHAEMQGFIEMCIARWQQIG